MISFANINKQYGKQLLLVDASFQLNPGEKVGLVGPNGAGKTTLFRMVVGEETPDESAVFVPRKLTIGYLRQDVEEMRGRSVLDEAIAGSEENRGRARSSTPPPPTLRVPERTRVALRSDLAHDNHQSSNFLLRLRQLRNNCGNFIEYLVPALQLTAIFRALHGFISNVGEFRLAVSEILKDGHVVRTVYSLMFYS